MIYFIQSNDYVKVGYTSNLKNRYKKYVTENPEPIKLIGKCNGGFDTEKKIHKQMHEWHYRGEWFYLTEASRIRLYEIIKENKDTVEPQKKPKVKKKSTSHVETSQLLRQYTTSTGYVDLTMETKQKVAEKQGVKVQTIDKHISALLKLKQLSRIDNIYYFL